jgi:hypothetical protein
MQSSLYWLFNYRVIEEEFIAVNSLKENPGKLKQISFLNFWKIREILLSFLLFFFWFFFDFQRSHFCVWFSFFLVYV